MQIEEFQETENMLHNKIDDLEKDIYSLKLKREL
jgi:hypothetical protein